AGGFRPLRLALRRRVAAQELRANPKLNPVCISEGALGNGLPERDLYVSRQHRMLVASDIARRMFAARRVLVAAIRLTELPGIRVVPAVRDVDYFHLLFDAHEIIFAEGAPTESLYTGANALAALTQEARDEIAALFLASLRADHQPEPAHLVLTGKQQRRLVARHLKNHRGILETADLAQSHDRR
ncbi:MAG: Hint domain-containing protein, partial [Albidovulum sp.]